MWDGIGGISLSGLYQVRSTTRSRRLERCPYNLSWIPPDKDSPSIPSHIADQSYYSTSPYSLCLILRHRQNFNYQHAANHLSWISPNEEPFFRFLKSLQFNQSLKSRVPITCLKLWMIAPLLGKVLGQVLKWVQKDVKLDESLFNPCLMNLEHSTR